MNKKRWQVMKFLAIALTVLVFIVGGMGGKIGSNQVKVIAAEEIENTSEPVSQPPNNQSRPQEVWKIVYQRLPKLPPENNYIDKETGKAAPENTLISRLIRYHVFVKGRSTLYRIDWQLTIADYLGANQPIESGTYPGHDILNKNPTESDLAAMKTLTRKQRAELVDTLVSIFNPNSPELVDPNSTQTKPINPSPSAPTSSETPNTPPPLPQPGDADLLKP